jgi:hypothetical protein
MTFFDDWKRAHPGQPYLCLRCGHMWAQAALAGIAAEPLCPRCSGRSAQLRGKSTDLDLSAELAADPGDDVTYQLCFTCQEMIDEEQMTRCEACERWFCASCYPAHQG